MLNLKTHRTHYIVYTISLSMYQKCVYSHVLYIQCMRYAKSKSSMYTVNINVSTLFKICTYIVKHKEKVVHNILTV